MRNLIVLLSIAAVLACPYECAVKLVAAQGIGSGAQPACCADCDAHRRTTPIGDPARNTPTPDEDGHGCLCEGAVIVGVARSPVDDSMRITPWIGDAGLAEFSKISAPSPRFERFTSPTPLDGRGKRIVNCSLLL